MSLNPKSPRVGRSPKLKAKWLSNTLAYQYGNTNGAKKKEILVLTNNLDQYLQDIFQSIDSKGRGKISHEELRLLCDVLYLKDTDILNDITGDVTFQEFHERLCEHFACYGDYTGFLVNQNFRTINVNREGESNNNNKLENRSDVAKQTEFKKRIANAKSHNCIHDTEIFKNWDKLRLSGFRLSEMRQHIDQMLYEVTFHKEESQSLKEIIEDLRTMLQSSDAQNIGLQVAQRQYQQQLSSETEYFYSKSLNRRSLQLDGTKIKYKPLKGEDQSVRILAKELTQLRELRDKEVKELISFNNQLQCDVTDLSREICSLDDENRKLNGQLELIVKTYACCRELFVVCVDSFKEVENANNGIATPDSDVMTPASVSTPSGSSSLKRKFSFSKTTSEPTDAVAILTDNALDIERSDSEADDIYLPEVIMIKRLEHEIQTQHDIFKVSKKEIQRLDKDLSNCRRHLQTSTFQVEALETECSRLLSLEDQLVSVFSLLQKGRTQCLSRKTLGQLLLDVIDCSFGQDEQDMTADQFIRMFQQTLSDCPLFLFST